MQIVFERALRGAFVVLLTVVVVGHQAAAPTGRETNVIASYTASHGCRAVYSCRLMSARVYIADAICRRFSLVHVFVALCARDVRVSPVGDSRSARIMPLG